MTYPTGQRGFGPTRLYRSYCLVFFGIGRPEPPGAEAGADNIPQIHCLRIMAETKSSKLTTTTIISSNAAVCPYSKLRIASHSSMPIPPAPTIPTTLAERTLDSKRYSA